MFAAPSNLDEVSAAAYVVDEVLFRVQRGAQLIAVSDLQIAAQPCAARLCFQFAGDEFDERTLARAVRSDYANAIATLDEQRAVIDHTFLAQGNATLSSSATSFPLRAASSSCSVALPV